MLGKSAIRRASFDPNQFLSNLFTIPKKGYELRPVINLKPLNHFVEYHHFKMEGLSSLLVLIRPNDYMITMDLKDAFLSVPIHADRSKYFLFRTQSCNVNGSLSTTSTVTCGVPQGSILGPLPFLMYINDLPNCLRDAAPRMFADDTNITLSAKTVADLKLAVTSELNNLTCWLRANRLSLNVAKTELMIIGSRQRLHSQCDEIDICIDEKMIKRVDHTKTLGLTVDALSTLLV